MKSTHLFIQFLVLVTLNQFNQKTPSLFGFSSGIGGVDGLWVRKPDSTGFTKGIVHHWKNDFENALGETPRPIETTRIEERQDWEKDLQSMFGVEKEDDHDPYDKLERLVRVKRIKRQSYNYRPPPNYSSRLRSPTVRSPGYVSQTPSRVYQSSTNLFQAPSYVPRRIIPSAISPPPSPLVMVEGMDQSGRVVVRRVTLPTDASSRPIDALARPTDALAKAGVTESSASSATVVSSSTEKPMEKKSSDAEVTTKVSSEGTSWDLRTTEDSLEKTTSSETLTKDSEISSPKSSEPPAHADSKAEPSDSLLQRILNKFSNTKAITVEPALEALRTSFGASRNTVVQNPEMSIPVTTNELAVPSRQKIDTQPSHTVKEVTLEFLDQEPLQQESKAIFPPHITVGKNTLESKPIKFSHEIHIQNGNTGILQPVSDSVTTSSEISPIEMPQITPETPQTAEPTRSTSRKPSTLQEGSLETTSSQAVIPKNDWSLKIAETTEPTSFTKNKSRIASPTSSSTTTASTSTTIASSSARTASTTQRLEGFTVQTTPSESFTAIMKQKVPESEVPRYVVHGSSIFPVIDEEKNVPDALKTLYRNEQLLELKKEDKWSSTFEDTVDQSLGADDLRVFETLPGLTALNPSVSPNRDQGQKDKVSISSPNRYAGVYGLYNEIAYQYPKLKSQVVDSNDEDEDDEIAFLKHKEEIQYRHKEFEDDEANDETAKESIAEAFSSLDPYSRLPNELIEAVFHRRKQQPTNTKSEDADEKFEESDDAWKKNFKSFLEMIISSRFHKEKILSRNGGNSNRRMDEESEDVADSLKHNISMPNALPVNNEEEKKKVEGFNKLLGLAVEAFEVINELIQVPGKGSQEEFAKNLQDQEDIFQDLQQITGIDTFVTAIPEGGFSPMRNPPTPVTVAPDALSDVEDKKPPETIVADTFSFDGTVEDVPSIPDNKLLQRILELDSSDDVSARSWNRRPQKKRMDDVDSLQPPETKGVSTVLGILQKFMSLEDRIDRWLY